jgi:branched-chain amino acid transport system ATP-binding protein
MSAESLRIDNVSKSFRGLRAVQNVSFAVPQGAIHAVIGPNGAGKTTLFNLVAGAFRPDSGAVHLGDTKLNGLRPDQICGAGIGRTFQIVKPFKTLTVEQNVTIGALHRTKDVTVARDRARSILDRLGLFDKRALPASSLTLPDRKRLEVARALATEPKVLLLDEVMAGLRPTEIDLMVQVLCGLNAERGITILLIEHVMRAVMALSQRVVVLHHGVKIAEGVPAEIVRDKAVLEVYLGEATP